MASKPKPAPDPLLQYEILYERIPPEQTEPRPEPWPF